MASTQQAGGSSGPSANMLFIVSSNTEKVEPATRKLIRSHVMRGKKQKRARPEKDRRTTSWHNWVSVVCRAQAAPVKIEDAIKAYAPLIPGRVGSDLSFVEFADAIEPSVVLNMIKCSCLGSSTRHG